MTLSHFSHLVNLLSFCLDVAQSQMKGHPMRLKLTQTDLLAKLANNYTTQGAPIYSSIYYLHITDTRIIK